MTMGWFVVYVITLFVANFVMNSIGCDIRSWQLWAITACIVLARLSGSSSKD